MHIPRKSKRGKFLIHLAIRGYIRLRLRQKYMGSS